MPIKLQNLNTAEPVPFDWGALRWLMSDQLESGAAQTLGFVEINPGQANPLHLHPNCEEILYVTSGTCEHIRSDETIIMRAGDIIRIPANVPHRARNIGNEPLQAIIAFSSGDRQTIMLEEPKP